MALIKCSECGNMVSDQSDHCIKCGAPIIRKVKCNECGAEYDETNAVCPNCGCPSTVNRHSAGDRYNCRQPNGYGSSMPPPRQGYAPFNSNMQNLGREQRVQRFLMTNAKYFPQMRMEEIRGMLLSLDGQKVSSVECMTFKDPMILLLISIFLGGLGVDRFMLNEIGTGVAKLITCLLCVGVIWWLIDLFQISDMTKEYNYKDLCMMLEYFNMG